MPNPIANPDQLAAEADVRAMRADPRGNPVRAQIAKYFEIGYGSRLPDEMRPMLGDLADEFLTNWFFKGAASDSQHPRLVRNFMPAYEWLGMSVPGARTGGDNPDNCYRLAGIAHGTRYRLSGRTNGKRAANISFTLTNNFGTSQTVALLEDHDLVWEDDGSFVIEIDDRPPDGRRNHLQTQEGNRFLFVRDSMMDWEAESPLDLTMERIGPAKAPPITLEEMFARATRHALRDVFQYFWFQNMVSSIAVNSILPALPLASSGVGMSTQGTSSGHFRIGPEEAIILTWDPAGAAYAAVELTDWLYRSLDYQRIQSSLTAAQASIDSDGLIRTVIARRDPGVWNWLDTGGYENVLMILRWQAMQPEGRAIFASATMTTIDALRSQLPTDTRWVNAWERAAQLARRVAGYQRRISPA